MMGKRVLTINDCGVLRDEAQLRRALRRVQLVHNELHRAGLDCIVTSGFIHSLRYCFGIEPIRLNLTEREHSALLARDMICSDIPTPHNEKTVMVGATIKQLKVK